MRADVGGAGRFRFAMEGQFLASTVGSVGSGPGRGLG